MHNALDFIFTESSYTRGVLLYLLKNIYPSDKGGRMLIYAKGIKGKIRYGRVTSVITDAQYS
ncbi:hypothetical protein DSJ_25800 (plasmid) [Pantoea stewartii subsp. stewartii DC283]|uniref:Uncharacterized protein n=1 Tax=Pantoea stewartii subsp. stewartii DC283 TaxID=660596 RepID=A0ABM6KDI5_PANSE|nr:hypothetical protein DSJ_25800 [Pantoea stewartii subsp. stewartii DC283]